MSVSLMSFCTVGRVGRREVGREGARGEGGWAMEAGESAGERAGGGRGRGADLNVNGEAEVLDDRAELVRRDLPRLVRVASQRYERVDCAAGPAGHSRVNRDPARRDRHSQAAIAWAGDAQDRPPLRTSVALVILAGLLCLLRGDHPEELGKVCGGGAATRGVEQDAARARAPRRGLCPAAAG